ncbi:MAG: large conductance mechanosensitive channel protein MscL [Clostridia bacterium]|nr:large conductance mechanosensitive channel protein MscL [Clostridia bacterium]
MAKKEKTGFFAEFKKFITRGNVVDMAVGVIIGGAFTAIVSGLSDHILKPIINWILALLLPGKGLEAAVTFLPKCKVYKEVVDPATNAVTKEVDFVNSLYIDWGAFISKIINFLLIALVLFMIVRMLNRINANRNGVIENAKLAKQERKVIKAIAKEQHVSMDTARSIYAQRLIDEAEAKAAEEAAAAAEAEAKAAEEARLAEEKAMANTVLLTEIRDLLKNK